MAVFSSNTADTSSKLPAARDAVQEEGAGTSSTSGEEVTQGSLSSSGATRNRDTPSSKTELGVRLVRNDVLAKTSGDDPLETESYLSQVKVFYFTFVLFL